MDRFLELIRDQCGVVSRRQAAAAGLSDSDIRRLLRRREWVVVHPGTYVNHTGPLTWIQRAWAAVLFAWPAALCHESALRAAEGPGRRRDGPIHVAIDRHRKLAPPAGVIVHRSAHLQARVQWNLGPPRYRYEEAALDVAASAPGELEAIGAIAEAVQSRRTTALRMLGTLEQRERMTRRRWMLAVLRDVADGAASVLEHGYLTRIERPHGLPRAQRQVRASATLGVVYRDVEYADLVLELDGRLFHDTAAQRDRDLDRDLDAAAEGRVSVRIGYGQVFDRPCTTAARVALLLIQRGWTGVPARCGPDCDLRGVLLSPTGSQPPRKEIAG
jgi:hypothetical protein